MSTPSHKSAAYWQQMAQVTAAVTASLDSMEDIAGVAVTVDHHYGTPGLLDLSMLLLAYVHQSCPPSLQRPDGTPDPEGLLRRPHRDHRVIRQTASAANRLLGRGPVTPADLTRSERVVSVIDATEDLVRAALDAAPDLSRMAAVLAPAAGDREKVSAVLTHALAAAKRIASRTDIPGFDGKPPQ